jgi:hypothetical protein
MGIWGPKPDDKAVVTNLRDRQAKGKFVHKVCELQFDYKPTKFGNF